MVYKNSIDPVQKRYWPSTKAILTQYKSDTGPVQKQYWPGTKAIPFDTVFSTVTQRVCTGSTGTRYKSGTGIRYRYVYRNGVQDVYRKVPYRYLVPYTTIPNRYHLPPLNSTGTGTDRYRNVYWDATQGWARWRSQPRPPSQQASERTTVSYRSQGRRGTVMARDPDVPGGAVTVPLQ